MATTPLNHTICTPSKPSSFSSDDPISKVRVILRVRPFLPHEIPGTTCISQFESDSSEQEEEVTVNLKDPYSCRNENYKVDELRSMQILHFLKNKSANHDH